MQFQRKSTGKSIQDGLSRNVQLLLILFNTVILSKAFSMFNAL